MIVSFAAKSWELDDHDPEARKFSPERAHDGNYNTIYQVKHEDTEGNYLKLYLSQKYKIGTVALTNRKEGCCEQRIVGTVVKVYSTEGDDEIPVATCGTKISGMWPPQFILKT